MKVIIAGSRSITDPALLEQVMAYVQAPGVKITEVIHGGASGVDTLAGAWAKARKIPVRVFRADWNQYGQAAGPLRNAEMAEYGDALVYLWDGVSAGTKSMINEAGKRHLAMCGFIWTGKEWLNGDAPIRPTEADE